MILPPLRGINLAFPFAIILCVFATVPLHAVIIEGGDGTGNTSPPADAIGDPGWAYVGHGNYSSVYLGNRWVLSCAHVGAAAQTTINGTPYTLDNSTPVIRLHQAPAPYGDNVSNIDLILYRITDQPPLPSLPISSSTPAQNSLVTAIGYGCDRGSAILNGFNVGPFNNTQRWGRNLISSPSSLLVDAGYGVNYAFQTTFDSSPTSPLDPNLAYNEFQAARGDSGGGVFYKDNNVWKLAGIMEAVTDLSTVHYGDSTYSIDLSYYRDQIVNVVQVYQFSGIMNNPRAVLGNPGQPDWQKMQLLGDGGFGDSTGDWFIPIDANGHKFTVTCTSNVTLNGIVSSSSGAGELIKEGAGKLTLSALNPLTGPTTINGGTLEIAIPGTLSNSPVTVNSGTLQIDVTGKTLNALTLSNGTTLSLLAQSGSTTAVSGVLSLATGGSFTLVPMFGARPTAATTYNLLTAGSVLGTGTSWSVNLANSRVGGAVTMNGTTLQFTTTTGAADLIWNAASGTWNLSLTSNFKNGGSSDVFKTYDAATFDNSVTSGGTKTITLAGILMPSSITINNTSAGGNYLFSGSGSLAGACPLVKTGTGSLTINSANTYFGGTTISGGTLLAGNAAALGTGAVTINGGMLDVSTTAVTGLGPLLLTNGTIQGTGSLSALSFEAQSGSISATLSGSASLTEKTTGTLTLSGVNDYSGGTNLEGGVLSFFDGSLGAAGQITFTGNSTLQWNSFSDDLSGRLMIGDGVNATIDTNDIDVNITLPFKLGTSRSGALTKTGLAMLNLSAANLYTGGTNLAGGTLSFSLGALGTTGSITFIGNSVLQWNVADTTQDANISSRLAINDGVTATLDTNGLNVNISQPFALGANKTAALTKIGLGTLALSAANLFNGDTNLSMGTLNVAHSNALQNSTLYFSVGTLAFDSGVVSHAFTLGGLSGSKALALTDTSSNPVALSVGNNGKNTTFSGAISGGGSLTKIGSGTLTLTGTLSYTGNTTVSGGTLIATSINSPTASVSVTGVGSILTATSIRVGSLASGASSSASAFAAQAASAVPEPNSIALLFLGMLGLGAFQYSRSKR